MNILFITIAWPAEGNQNLYTDLMHTFRDEGHRVTVACSAQKREGLSTTIKAEKGMEVLRIRTGNLSKTGQLEKSISLLQLNGQFRRAIGKYLSGRSYDLILFNTPPITMSPLLDSLKRKYDSPLYLLLKDIWPYGFADLGAMKRGGMAWRYFKQHEKRIYNIADYIGCMSPAGVKFIMEQYPGLPSDKVEVCPNSTHLADKKFEPNPEIRQKYGIPADATVFLFSGNLGKGHGLGFLTDAIERLNTYEKAFFLIGGAGTHFESVKEALKKSMPENVFLYSYLPKEDFEQLLGICDVGMILLDKCYTYPQFPSRLLAYLKSEMAVLCAVNKETDIGDIVEKAGAGTQVLHGDSHAFIECVKELSENREVTVQMGQKSLQLLKERYTVEHSYKVIMRHFE